MSEEKKVIESTLYKGKVSIRFFEESHVYMVDGERKVSCTTVCGIKDKSGALVPWALEEAAKHLVAVKESGKVIDEEQIIKAVFASDKARDKAADLGTRIHAIIEQYILHKISPKKYAMPDMPEDQSEMTGVASFLQWESEHRVKFLWAEKLVYSKKHDYIGKADFAAMVDGKKCLCDLKTGNGLYNSVKMQTAAYVAADTEECGTVYKGRWAIRIAKETADEYLTRMEYKNQIKRLLGKKETVVQDYVVFEAKFLDEKGTEQKEDFKAFTCALGLLNWDKRNYYL